MGFDEVNASSWFRSSWVFGIFELAYSRSADCDTTLHCSRYLINCHTGQRRRIGPAPINNNKYGTVADDGRYAALWNWTRSAPPS